MVCNQPQLGAKAITIGTSWDHPGFMVCDSSTKYNGYLLSKTSLTPWISSAQNPNITAVDGFLACTTDFAARL